MPSILVGLAFLALSASPLPAGSAEHLDPAKVKWTEARLRATKLGLVGYSRLQIEEPPREEVAEALLAAGDWEGLEPSTNGTLLATVATNALGRDSTSKVWLDPLRGAAYQDLRVERRSGRGQYKMQRIAPAGVYTLRRQSIRGGFQTSIETWERVREQYQPLTREPASEPVVSTPTGLFYVAGAAPLDEVGDRWRISLWTRGRELLVEMRVVAEEKREVDIKRLDSGGEPGLAGEREALRISLSGRWGDVRGDGRGPEILGLRSVELLLDRETRAPLEVRGRVAFLGTVRFFLRELRLGERTHTSPAILGVDE
jgi:hypothetical protein